MGNNLFFQMDHSITELTCRHICSPPAVSSSGGPCDAGYYCPVGTANQIPCAAGTYNSIPLQSVCLNCPAGYYCMEGATNITDCPKGERYFDHLLEIVPYSITSSASQFCMSFH